MPTSQTGFILSRETAAKNSKKLVGYKTRTLSCGLKTARHARTASDKSSTPPPRHTKKTTKKSQLYTLEETTGSCALAGADGCICLMSMVVQYRGGGSFAAASEDQERGRLPSAPYR